MKIANLNTFPVNAPIVHSDGREDYVYIMPRAKVSLPPGAVLKGNLDKVRILEGNK